MPILDKPEHEEFAFLMGSKGLDKAAAYAKAYDCKKINSCVVSALRLLRIAPIVQRIAEFKAAISEQRVQQAAVALAEDPTMFTSVGRAKIYREEVLKLNEVIEERAALYGQDEEIPGGATGYVVPFTQGIGSGKNFFTETRAKLDKELLDRRSSALTSIAKELGQWVEKAENKNVSPSEWGVSEWDSWLKAQEAKTGVPVSVVQADLEAQEKPN